MQGAYFLFLGPMGLIGPMGPISCDGSYRFYGIDHDGANRFYGIDLDNGPKLVGTASFEFDPAMSSERCCWQSSPSPLRPDERDLRENFIGASGISVGRKKPSHGTSSRIADHRGRQPSAVLQPFRK